MSLIKMQIKNVYLNRRLWYKSHYSILLKVTIAIMALIGLCKSCGIFYSEYITPEFEYCYWGECNEAQKSVFAKIGPLPVPLLGIGGMGFLLFLGITSLYRKHFMSIAIEKIIFLVSIIGVAFAGYFIYIQVVVLKVICGSCMIVDSIMILLFGAALKLYVNLRDNP